MSMTEHDVFLEIASILKEESDPDEAWDEILGLLDIGASVQLILDILQQIKTPQVNSYYARLFGAQEMWDALSSKNKNIILEYALSNSGDTIDLEEDLLAISELLYLALGNDGYLAFLEQKQS